MSKSKEEPVEVVTFVVDTTGSADNRENETSSEAIDIKLPKNR